MRGRLFVLESWGAGEGFFAVPRPTKKGGKEHLIGSVRISFQEGKDILEDLLRVLPGYR